MIKTFTQNDLIRFIYKETSFAESKEIRKALLFDSDLLEKFKELKDCIRKLDSIEEAPSQKILHNILEYSKTLNLHSVKD